jgi:hypothetical protein
MPAVQIEVRLRPRGRRNELLGMRADLSPVTAGVAGLESGGAVG